MIEYRQYAPEVSDVEIRKAENIVRSNISASASETDDAGEFYGDVDITISAQEIPGCGGPTDLEGIWVCGSLDREPRTDIDATPQGHGKAAKVAKPRILTPDEFEAHMATKSAAQRGE